MGAIMKTRHRIALIVALTVHFALPPAGQPSTKETSLGDSNNSQQTGNEKGRRRNRNRNNTTQSDGSLQLGGAGAPQQLQQTIEVLQVNPKDGQQPGESANGALQIGKQLKKVQQLQNWTHKDQANWKKKHKHKHKYDDWQGWAIQFGGPAPFSAQWYSHHPHAWHHHHHDDAWNVATAAGVLAWLGWHVHPYHGHTVLYEPMPVETIYVDGQPPVVDPVPGNWMTLGVYSLATGPAESEMRMLELAIDKFGRVRGNYYDAILNTSHTVTGRIDQHTQFVQWSLDANKQLTFYAPLSELTQPQGVVSVRFPGGQEEQWQLRRMESGEN